MVVPHLLQVIFLSKVKPMEFADAVAVAPPQCVYVWPLSPSSGELHLVAVDVP
jgi:hypothetical protein